VADPDRNDIQAGDAVNNPLGATVGLLGLRNKGDCDKRARSRDIARALSKADAATRGRWPAGAAIH
jgi:hypothetical protein